MLFFLKATKYWYFFLFPHKNIPDGLQLEAHQPGTSYEPHWYMFL